MGLFDFFKKDKLPGYDASNLRVSDLDKGFVFEYNLQNWVIEAVYEYDWGNNFFSREYKINNGSEIRYLNVEDDDELYISIFEKAKVRSIQENLPEYINENDKPPKKLIYKDVTYYYDEESFGYFKELYEDNEEEAKVISWDYYDESEKLILSIEQWGDEDFEASSGKVIEEFEISNILPSDK